MQPERLKGRIMRNATPTRATVPPIPASIRTSKVQSGARRAVRLIEPVHMVQIVKLTRLVANVFVRIGRCVDE
jgi:hypothetical protein